MRCAFTMVLDSSGIGVTEGVERFGNVGADTLGYIVGVCIRSETGSGRKGPLSLPNLTRLGLAKAHEDSTGFIPTGMDGNAEVIGVYAWTYEMSSGKDTPSGRWGITGAPVLFEWEYFSDHKNSFPQELLDKLAERANLLGYLSDCHSPGTVILDRLGEEHMKTGKPISYTSADSVFRIACHEGAFGLDKLYELCEVAREEPTNSGHNIGRVTTRPFTGDKADSSQHTGNRRDLTVGPPASTALQKLVDGKHDQVVSVGKVTDTYINCGITKEVKATGPDTLFDIITKEVKEAGDNTTVFTNFVDFDSPWGHCYDVTGYAAGLELFDRRLSELVSLSRDDDILIPTAGHGHGPTWTGTNHTREHILVLVYGPKVKPGSLGHRETFVDIDQTPTEYFGTSGMKYGKAMF